MKFKLEILAPNAEIAKADNVSEVLIPAHWGQMGILPHHTEFVTTLKPGKLAYRSNDKQHTFQITGGLFTVKGDSITALVDGVVNSGRNSP